MFFVATNDILVHGEVRGREYHEGQIGRLATEVRVSALLRDLLLGVLGFASGGDNIGEAQILTF
jgi:hypothetical protein